MHRALGTLAPKLSDSNFDNCNVKGQFWKPINSREQLGCSLKKLDSRKGSKILGWREYKRLCETKTYHCPVALARKQDNVRYLTKNVHLFEHIAPFLLAEDAASSLHATF